jgi:4-hydroxybenzoate polyprenyltransferase
MIKGFKFITYTNIWVSLGAAAFTAFSYVAYPIPVNYYYLLFVFSATLSVYNFHRLIRFFNPKTNPHLSERHLWIIKHLKALKITTLLASALLIWATIHLPFVPLMQLLLPVTAVIALYVLPDNRFFKGLRHLPFLKLLLVGFIWSYVAVFIPFSLQKISVPVYFFIAQILFIIAITLPFDIRDIAIDKAENVTGIATAFGQKGAKITAYALLLLALWLASYDLHLLSKVFWTYGISIVVCLPIVYFSAPKNPELYFSGLVESALFFPLTFWAIFHFLHL